MSLNKRVNDSVSSIVTADVSSDLGTSDTLKESVKPRVQVAHLSCDHSGWIFQRRIPMSLRTSKSKRVVKARLWPMAIGEARLVSRHLGYWTDCVFAVLKEATSMFDQLDFSDPEALLAGMTQEEIDRLLSAMQGAFDEEVQRLRQQETLHPNDNTTGVIKAVKTLQHEIEELRSSPEVLQKHCDIDGAVSRIEAEQTVVLSKSEMAKGYTEINVMSSRAKSLAALRECFKRAPTSIPVMMAALAALSEIYDERQEPSVEAEPASTPPTESDFPQQNEPQAAPIEQDLCDSANKNAVLGPTEGDNLDEANNLRTSGAIQSEIEPAEAQGSSISSVTTQSPEPVQSKPMFAGMVDRAKVHRPNALNSPYPYLSIAAGEYLQGWARRLGWSIPAELKKSDWDEEIEEPDGVGTARTRVQVFIDLIGDHPIDTYKTRDFQTFVDLVVRYPKNAKQSKACRGVPTRELILGRRANGFSNVDTSEFITFAKVTIKDGYLAPINSAIRAWRDEQEELDKLQGISTGDLRYPDETVRHVNNDQISRRTVTSVLEAGLETGRLTDTMLPLFGLLATRRLGLLTHMIGTDISAQYDDDEARPVYTVSAKKIVMIKGKKVKRPLKTSDSEKTFTIHKVLTEIGFTDWLLQRGDDYVFEALHLYADPSRNASKRMSRLFSRSGASEGETFKSLRSLGIDIYDDETEKSGRAIRQMSGHAARDVHDGNYGTKGLTENRAIALMNIPLPQWLDEMTDMFRGLDFDKLARADLRLTRQDIKKAAERDAKSNGSNTYD